jgi:hypothetical protein
MTDLIAGAFYWATSEDQEGDKPTVVQVSTVLGRIPNTGRLSPLDPIGII